MSFPDQFNPNNRDLFRVLVEIFSDPQRLQWELASELARVSSGVDGKDANVDPIARSKLEEIFHAAELLVSSSQDFSMGSSVYGTPNIITPPEWALVTLAEWKPLLSVVANAHAQQFKFEPRMQTDDGFNPIDMGGMFGQAAQALGPALIGMQIGTSIGNVARRTFGNFDIPIPRESKTTVCLVSTNIESFANDWSLSLEDVALWASIREIATAQLLDIPHISQALLEPLNSYAMNFSPDAGALEDKLSAIDITDLSDFSQMQSIFGDPSLISASTPTPLQREAMEQSSTMFSLIEGWAEYVASTLSSKLISSHGPLTEALRRARVEREEEQDYLDIFLGLNTTQEQIDLGAKFVNGLVERIGPARLGEIWKDAAHLPTPAELDAPGLWIERVSFLDAS